MKAEGWKMNGVTMNGERGMTKRKKKPQIAQASPDLLGYWKS
jgi:hypothetical protein